MEKKIENNIQGAAVVWIKIKIQSYNQGRHNNIIEDTGPPALK